MDNNWFKNMAFYQIWIRSFADGNGDGIGDLYGVYDKLEYIKSLGIDGIWFSPIYPSPNADYGYDVSDYKDIHPDYGDLEQFKKVLNKAHELGMKVIMDLVINHTSDEHFWFKESCKGGEDNPYKDYYIWRDGKIDKNGHKKLPNNWNSLFEGKAWEYNEERGQYYLHFFAKKQPDLNMDNPRVREEIKDIMRFWLDLGVDGFREDSIAFISKVEGLPNGYPELPMINGLRYTQHGPHIHEYMKEFREVCEDYDCFQMGEMPMTGPDKAMPYLTGDTKSLDMVITFDYMNADNFLSDFIRRPFNVVKYKRAFSKWQYAMNGKSWNCVYIENHDHPRVVSRYGSEKMWRESATSLAASYIFLQGCPFIYQGQEIGMTNLRLNSIDKYEDISSKNAYMTFHTKKSKSQRLYYIGEGSRDSARTPMQWSDGKYAGFSTVKPWFYLNPNYKKINVKAQEEDEKSILNFYRKALKLRKDSDALIWGDYKEYFPKDKNVYTYERTLSSEKFLIICNLKGKHISYKMPEEYVGLKGELKLSNYEDGHRLDILRPYECRVYKYE
ncbi:glycoside hydrolase family 13 protein [Lachnospira sp.]|uniref:glycoside hydrolase family 13 protein n=1 Tax=Lachnospira sp. TaxID=2049031 RepID=UPI00257EF644|nr:alpha-glucosidase [Lachnospira sp.]